MFCSHCGKSVLPEDITCPHCGAELGEERFAGNMYTSTQARLAIDELDKVPAGSLSAFTRTEYMSYDNQPKDDVYSNTSYRPTFSEAETESATEPDEEPAPREGYDTYADYEEPPYTDEPAEENAPSESEEEQSPSEEEPVVVEEPPVEKEESPVKPQPEPQTRKARTAARRAQEPIETVADETLEAYDLDDDEPSTSPLPDIGPGGINEKVRGYMQARRAREEQQEERAQKGASLREKLFSLGRRKAQPEPEAEAPETAYDEDEAYQAAEPAAKPASVDQTADSTIEAEDADDVYEGEEDDGMYPEDGEVAEEAAPLAGTWALIKTKLNDRRVRIVLVSLLVVIVLALGIRWLIYISSSLGTKIAGVTRSTYSDGIKLMDEYTTDAYRESLVSTAAINENYAQQQMDADYAKIAALLPAEPQENDELFVDALTTIHKSVQNVILRDADAVYNDTTAERAADAEREWSIVKNAVQTLKDATAASQLSALTSDVQAGVMPTPSPTPAPTSTPEPTYSTLREGLNDSAAVQAMQSRLIELGYLSGKADGDYGPKTSAAVRAFQQQAGLTVDGVGTAETQEALFAPDAPQAPTATDTTEGTTEGATEGDDDAAAQAIFDVVAL